MLDDDDEKEFIKTKLMKEKQSHRCCKINKKTEEVMD